MTKESYQEWMRRVKGHRPSNFRASLWCSYMILWPFVSLSLSILALRMSSQILANLLYVMCQILLGFSILGNFTLLHDLGHNRFFRSRWLNDFLGQLTSVIVILPFYPWRAIHSAHHFWAGWLDRDPTLMQVHKGTREAQVRPLVDFCWRYWIPVFSLAFSFSNFWNLKKLQRLFPKDLAKFVWSMALPILVHGFLLCFFQFSYLRIWLPGYCVFLFLSDPLLLSQHGNIAQDVAGGAPVKPKAFYEQDAFTRALVFPWFFSRFFLLHFDRHVVHHLFPWVPGYDLDKFPQNLSQDFEENWWVWLKRVKSMSGSEFIYRLSAKK